MTRGAVQIPSNGSENWSNQPVVPRIAHSGEYGGAGELPKQKQKNMHKLLRGNRSPSLSKVSFTTILHWQKDLFTGAVEAIR